MSEQRLLVTFALFTYNQEAYVAEAVEGALSQDYSPLEIIISDDASTDRTFDIIREMVDRYRGPHEIRLIRNEVNLGIGAHVTKVANMARGELIVAAAGDDVSLPGRSSAMVAVWERHSRTPDLIGCEADRIDPAGRSIRHATQTRGVGTTELSGDEIARHDRLVVGATATWTKRLWCLNPELPADCVFEDHVMSLRAAMSGGVARTRSQFVKYRVGAGISHVPPAGDHETNRQQLAQWVERRLRSLAIQIGDAQRHGREDLVLHLERYARELNIVRAIYRSGELPALRAWRRALGIRSIRMALSAIAATKHPRAYQKVLSIRRMLRYWTGRTTRV